MLSPTKSSKRKFMYSNFSRMFGCSNMLVSHLVGGFIPSENLFANGIFSSQVWTVWKETKWAWNRQADFLVHNFPRHSWQRSRFLVAIPPMVNWTRLSWAMECFQWLVRWSPMPRKNCTSWPFSSGLGNAGTKWGYNSSWIWGIFWDDFKQCLMLRMSSQVYTPWQFHAISRWKMIHVVRWFTC
jgi:hypothetical protein